MFRLFPALLAFLALSTSAPAAPRTEGKDNGLPVVAQAKSLNDLIALVKTTVKNVAGEKLAKEIEKDVLSQIDPARLPGIDPKRPFGAYATLDADVTKCRVVLIIPTQGANDFLAMLEQFGLRAGKARDDGTFDIPIKPDPDIPFTVSGRVHEGYAYIALGGSDALSAKAIVEPKDVINSKETAAATLTIRADRIPAELKKLVQAGYQEQFDMRKDAIPEAELKEVVGLLHGLGKRWLRSVFDEGREITVRLEVDTKTGDLTVETAIEGKPKSALAEAIAQRPPTKNAFAAIAGDDYVQRIYASAPLFADEVKEALVKLTDLGAKAALDVAKGENFPAEAVTAIEAGFKSLKATLESGEMDMAFAFRGPSKDGFYSGIAAVHCKETAQLEKAVKGLVGLVPEPWKGYIKLDAAKIGDVAVHQMDLSKEVDEEILKNLFGKAQTAYLAVGKNAVYLAYGPDGLKFIKEAIEAKPQPASAFESGADSKRLKQFIGHLKDAQANKPALAGFLGLGGAESMAGGFRVAVDGGSRLKVRVTYNFGFLFAFFGAAWADFEAVPPVKE